MMLAEISFCWSVRMEEIVRRGFAATARLGVVGTLQAQGAQGPASGPRHAERFSASRLRSATVQCVLGVVGTGCPPTGHK